MSEIRLVIAIPSSGRVATDFAYSLAGMVGKLASGCPTVPEAAIALSMDVVCSTNWIENREQLVLRAIEANKTHLMFLDDDMAFDPRVLEIMLGRRQHVVCCNYLIKNEPAKDFVAVGMNGDRLPTTESSTGIQPIQYSGFGVSLFTLEAMKAVAPPRFLPDFDAQQGKYTTEDNPFFRKIREAGFPVYVDHDASKLVSHIGQRAWNWQEVKHG